MDDINKQVCDSYMSHLETRNHLRQYGRIVGQYKRLMDTNYIIVY